MDKVGGKRSVHMCCKMKTKKNLIMNKSRKNSPKSKQFAEKLCLPSGCEEFVILIA